MFLVVSTSLHPESRSRILATRAREHLEHEGAPTAWLDLREITLPFCDGESCYDDPRVVALAEQIQAAEGILLATPIYNYWVSAAAKNLIELTGDAWSGKAVGFLCAAGGQSSYMSVMGLANCLMLDFRCHIVPRFVYSTSQSFAEGRVVDPEVDRRLLEVARAVILLARLPQ